MREILFRGKQTDNNNWVEGAFCLKDSDGPFGDMLDRPSIIKYDPPWDGFWFRVDPETVGQFTGLFDKNGKKIFEGDIIEHHAQGNIIVNRGVVVWDASEGRFAYQLRTMLPGFYMHNPETVEVIGNIHDNPELLQNITHQSQ